MDQILATPKKLSIQSAYLLSQVCASDIVFLKKHGLRAYYLRHLEKSGKPVCYNASIDRNQAIELFDIAGDIMEDAHIDAPLQGYAAINNAWGCDPKTLRKPTDKEAIKACRLLLNEGFRHFADDPKIYRRRRKFKIVHGRRRRTWPHRGIWHVNPDEYDLGFAEIIHSVSHWVHLHVNRGFARKHGGGHNGHAHIEQYLIDWVIKQQWIERGLKV